MGRKTFVANWLWIALAFDYFITENTSLTTLSNSTYQSYTNYANELNSTTPIDSELSGSERSRRLIPYMAFYLPPSELPINQQYAIQTPQQNRYTTNSSEHQPPPTAIESAGPLPPTGYIAIPTYVKASAIGASGTTPLYNVQQQKQARYRPVNYENQYAAPINLKSQNGNIQPLLHLLPPGSTSGNAFVGAIFRDAQPSKHKTIQHFPPLYQQNAPSQEHTQEQQRYQEQPILYRQRVPQSKINITPFTSSNTLPGNFVPIIYTPQSNGVKSDSSNNQNGKTINYNYDDLPEEEPSQSQQQQQQYESTYKGLQQTQQQIIAEPLPSPSSAADATSKGKEAHLLYQQKQQPQINFIAIAGVTGPSAGSATSAQSGPVYHIIKESSPSISPQHQQLITLKPQQQLQYRPIPSKNSHFHTPQPESYFPNEQMQHDKRHHHVQQQLPPQQQYFDVNDLTPQEKYVLFLRQRIRYNKQQQQQQQKHKHHEHTTTKDRKQQYLVPHYEQQQQPPPPKQQSETVNPDVFIYNTMTSPVEQESVHLKQVPQHHPQHSSQPHNAYLRPQLSAPSNHKSTPKSSSARPLQQVLHIPVKTLLSEIDGLPKAIPNKLTHSQRYHVRQQSKYINSYGNSNTQYVDDVVEEPKQNLEEQYPQKISNQQPELNSVSAPQAAYIIITTAKPPYQADIPSQQQDYHLSTQRPIYQHTPTLRLQPITTQDAKYSYVTKRPTLVLSSTTPALLKHNSNTKQYEIKYVTPAQNFSPTITSPTPPIKLRPATKYEANTRTPIPAPVSNYNATPLKNYELEDSNQLPDIRTSSLAEILHKLQASNHLPQTLTADNIDNSIKTLITILNNLKNTQKIVPNPPQHHEPPAVLTDYDYSNNNDDDDHNDGAQDLTLLPPPASSGPNKHPGPSTGRAGIDFPNYAEIPQTSFDCTQQRYKGFFGDPETNCQVWHYCDLNGGKASFLCPNGTIFSQIALTCDWWFNVKCSTTSQLYVLNERLYKYILPFNPKFPEDYSGPLVDKYLAMKFQEMEDKMRLEKEKLTVKSEHEENHIEETTTNDDSTTLSSEKTRQKVDEQSSEKNLLTDDIADDIAQKGSYDTYDSSTKPTSTTNDYEKEHIAFSIEPIVVPSSTIEAVHSDESNLTDEEEEEITNTTNEHRDIGEQHINYERSPAAEKHEKNQPQIDSSKISVEKVEVIEIKSDGTSGHLTPEMFFADMDRKS